VPDGTSKRHIPADGSPAEPIPRPHSPRYAGTGGRDPVEPDYEDPRNRGDDGAGYPDAAGDPGGRRSGRARRVANWFGFGAPPEEDEPDPYERRTGFGRRDPYEADADSYDYGRDQETTYDDDYNSPPPTPRSRRRSESSRWEDVMLGSSPSPGTPMSDSIPGDIMAPDRLHRNPPGVVPPSRGRGGPGNRDEQPRWAGDHNDVEPADPMDPVDPLDPGPTPSSARRAGFRAATARTTDADTDSGRVPRPPRPTRPATSVAPTADTEAVPVADDEGADARYRDAAGEDDAPATTFIPAPTGTSLPPRSPRPGADDDAGLDEVPRRMLRMLPPPALADGGGMVVDGGRLNRLTVRAAGVRGELHQSQGLPRQNCFAIGPDPSGDWTLAIVCDGVDNAHASELAAQIAVRSAYRAVARMVSRERHENWDWAGVQNEVEEDLRTRLSTMADRAHELGRPEPATRLAILVTSADPLEDDRVDMAVLGDSTVLRLAQGGWRAPLGIRDASVELAPAALPDQAGDDQLRICRTTWRPTDVLVMMTGGFADALGRPTAGLAPRLAEDWRTPPSLFDFLRDVDEGLRVREDDGCVVALWPSP